MRRQPQMLWTHSYEEAGTLRVSRRGEYRRLRRLSAAHTPYTALAGRHLNGLAVPRIFQPNVGLHAEVAPSVLTARTIRDADIRRCGGSPALVTDIFVHPVASGTASDRSGKSKNPEKQNEALTTFRPEPPI